MLNDAQRAAIDRHLRKDNWLITEKLIAELSDHYVEGITARMTSPGEAAPAGRSPGVTFEQALVEVHAGFGERNGLLAMEQEYQTQQAKLPQVLLHSELRQFFTGSRILITLSLFGFFYVVNDYVTNGGTALESFFYIGLWLMVATFAAAMFHNLFLLVKVARSRENWQTLNRRSPWLINVLLQASALLILFSDAYLPAPWRLLTATVAQTLCVIYYVAMARSLFTFTKSLSVKPA